MLTVLQNLLALMVGEEVAVAAALQPHLSRAQVPRLILGQVDLRVEHVLQQQGLVRVVLVDPAQIFWHEFGSVLFRSGSGSCLS